MKGVARVRRPLKKILRISNNKIVCREMRLILCVLIPFLRIASGKFYAFFRLALVRMLTNVCQMLSALTIAVVCVCVM
jgi:hypothetical protein